MLRNPSVEMSSGIGFSTSLFHGYPDHGQPARNIWRGKLGNIKHDRLLISSVYAEVKFGEIHQTVGSEGLGSLVDETHVVPHLRFDYENAGG